MSGLNRVEVVVVLVLIVVLSAVVLPWLLSSREDSRLVHCRNNLRNIGKALNEYASLNTNTYPYGTVVDTELPPERRLAWTVPTTAYFDKSVLAALDLNAAWDAPANSQIDDDDPPVKKRFLRYARFHCPADTNVSPSGKLQLSSYVGMAGVGNDAPTWVEPRPQAGVWGYDRQTSFEQMTDGREYTISVLETSRDNGPWIAGGPPTVRPFVPTGGAHLGGNGQFGGHHAKGCVILFADNSVQVFHPETDRDAFARLCTIAADAKQ